MRYRIIYDPIAGRAVPDAEAERMARRILRDQEGPPVSNALVVQWFRRLLLEEWERFPFNRPEEWEIVDRSGVNPDKETVIPLNERAGIELPKHSYMYDSIRNSQAIVRDAIRIGKALTREENA